MPKVCLVCVLSKVRVCTQVLMKLGAFYIITSVLHVSQRITRSFLVQNHTVKQTRKCKKKKKKKKNMSQHIVKGLIRELFGIVVGSNFDQEFGVDKTESIRWFNTLKAFDSVYDGRTYSQVATKTPAFSHSQHDNHGHNKKGTRTVIIRRRNGNAVLVTCSKV